MKNSAVMPILKECVLWSYSKVIKALPPGTKRQRKDGVYEKQPNGKWVKVKEKKKEEQEKVFDLPQDRTKMTPEQNREVVEHFKKTYSEKQLNKRISLIDAQIKRREAELEREGIDFRRKPDKGLNNLWHDRTLTETAIEEIRDKKIK